MRRLERQRTDGGLPIAHRGLRRIARRLGVSKDTVNRWQAAWCLPLLPMPAASPTGWVYVLSEPMAQEWERRRAEQIQEELRNGRRPNPLRYRRGRCPHCKVILQRLAADRLASRQENAR
jgi:hypothetical protein